MPASPRNCSPAALRSRCISRDESAQLPDPGFRPQRHQHGGRDSRPVRVLHGRRVVAGGHRQSQGPIRGSRSQPNQRRTGCVRVTEIAAPPASPTAVRRRSRAWQLAALGRGGTARRVDSMPGHDERADSGGRLPISPSASKTPASHTPWAPGGRILATRCCCASFAIPASRRRAWSANAGARTT